LVSANFSKEITTSVLWLNEWDLDIRCVRFTYEFNEKTLLIFSRVLALPESTEYQIRLRRKAAEERNTQVSGADWTRYDLKIDEKSYSKLYKRDLFLRVMRALVDQGKSVRQLQEILPARKFVGVPGNLTGTDFRGAVSEMRTQRGAAMILSDIILPIRSCFFPTERLGRSVTNGRSMRFPRSIN
jgi:hypothetical protein